MRILCSGCQSWIPVGSTRPGSRVPCGNCGAANVVPSDTPAGHVKPVRARPAPSSPTGIRSGQRPPNPRAPQVAKPAGSPPNPNSGLMWQIGAASGLVLLTLCVCGLILMLRAGKSPEDPKNNNPTPMAQAPNEGPDSDEADPSNEPNEPNEPGGFGAPIQGNPQGTQRPPTQQAVQSPSPVEGSGQQMVTFLGAQAQGRRFCIIADRSGSMRLTRVTEKPPRIRRRAKYYTLMDYLKKEMASTLKSVQSQNNFYVLFFSTRETHMPQKRWLNGGKEADQVIKWVNRTSANGNTNPYPAFRAAFQLKPRPDVIFFMTDGIIPANTAAAVARLNTGPNKVRIYPIHLVAKGPDRRGLARRFAALQAQLKRIAKDSGGSYRETIAGYR